MDERNDSSSQLRKSLAAYYGSRVVGLVLGLVFQIAVVKILVPEQFAVFSLLQALLFSGERLLSFGLDRTILRFVPPLTSHGDLMGLNKLALGWLGVRCFANLLMVAGIAIGGFVIRQDLGLDVSTATLVAFGLWFVAFSLTTDADCLAQSWLLHSSSAISMTVEIVLRVAIVIALATMHAPITAQQIVVVCAATSTIAVAGLLVRLGFGAARIRLRTSTAGSHPSLARAPSFAVAAYASTLGWWVTSPPVLRVAATTGISTVAFAAFSFVQGLANSAQRGFPGQLVLPSIEALVSRTLHLPHNLRMDRVLRWLSVVFKLDLMMVLAVSIVFIVAGEEIIGKISKPVYAPYYYVLPFVMILQLMQTVYRITELVLGFRLRHPIFLTTLPIAVLSLLAIVLMAPKFGLLAVLVIPLVESSTRLSFILYVGRSDKIWRALDPGRSLTIASIGILSASMGTVARQLLAGETIEIAIVAAAAFVGAMALYRPFSRAEFGAVTSAIPRLPRWLRMSALLLVQHSRTKARNAQ